MSPRWAALACDYDGTLASSSRVRTAILEALRQVRHRKLLLVTGRFATVLSTETLSNSDARSKAASGTLIADTGSDRGIQASWESYSTKTVTSENITEPASAVWIQCSS